MPRRPLAFAVGPNGLTTVVRWGRPRHIEPHKIRSAYLVSAGFAEARSYRRLDLARWWPFDFGREEPMVLLELREGPPVTFAVKEAESCVAALRVRTTLT